MLLDINFLLKKSLKESRLMLEFLDQFNKFLNKKCYLSDHNHIIRKSNFDTKTIFHLILELCKSENSDIRSINNPSLESFSTSSFSDARNKMAPFFFQGMSQWIYRYIENRDYRSSMVFFRICGESSLAKS